MENLFETIMKENVSNLAKEIVFQEVQEAQRVPKKLDPRKHPPMYITMYIDTMYIITLPKIKDKERILEAAREKEIVAGKKGLERSIQSHEKQEPTSKITLSSKAII